MKKILWLMMGLLWLYPLGAYADESPLPFADSQLRRMVTLPGTGRQMYYYAQNDPIWAKTRYELKNGNGLRRTFGGGGCNPTALAMAIVNLVEEEELPIIAQHTKEERPVAFCPGTVSGFFCVNHQEDATLVLTQPEQYKKLLPLVLGHYACYNNDQGRTFRTKQDGGTTYKMFYPVAEMYGLTLTSTRDLDEALAALHTGSQVVVLSAGRNQPFSEASGHFVVLADSDAEAIYLLEPQIVDEYPKDRRQALEQVEGEPGVLRVAREKVDRLCVSYYFIFTRPEKASGE